MKKFVFIPLIIPLVIVISLFFAPILGYADCNKTGATVVYINGIFGTEESAKNDLKKLSHEYDNKGKQKDVTFINGFNESHVNGLDDLIKSAEQAYGAQYMDYDLTNILNKLHNDLKTQKILLVGYSQGSFYSNTAYDYLTTHGVDKDSIAVYNIGTPADRVAGGGKYLTSSSDKVINSIVLSFTKKSFARKPLPPNIDLKVPKNEEFDSFGGHYFSKDYLALAPDRIISDIDEALSKLKVSGNKNECFVKPATGIAYKIEGAGYYVAETIDQNSQYFATTPHTPEPIASFANFLFQKIYSLSQQVASFWGASLSSSAVTETINLADSLRQEPPLVAPKMQIALFDFAGTGGPSTNPVTELGRQDLLDNIQERLDIISSQVQVLALQQNQSPQPVVTPEPVTQNNQQNNQADTAQNNYQTSVAVSSSAVYSGPSGGTSLINYQKILISEVQTGTSGDDKQEFVELYNPNDQEISLTGWYLQRKTASGTPWSTYGPNSLFSGRKISANGYFLIARAGYYTGLADIFTDNPITSDNSFALKNPNGDISDKLGFGAAQDYETLPAVSPSASLGQSIGRKFADNQETETEDNFADFELQTPTPKAQNTVYVQEPVPGGAEGVTLTDTDSPQIDFTLQAIQKNTSFTISFTITDIAQTVSPSGIKSYVFKWQEQGKDWQEDPVAQVNGSVETGNFSRNFLGEDGKTYNFQIKATDTSGNESDWQPELPITTQIVVPKTILINEIQIDSTVGVGGTSDDWVELYNPNSVDVSLRGWSIQKFGSDDPCSLDKSYYKKNFPDDAVIKAKSYFLLVSTQANESLKALANGTIGWSLSDNNTIYLVNDQEKIIDGSDADISDKVGFGQTSCFSETSPAATPPEAKSIERKIIGGDTDNNFADFRISDNPTPGAGFMQIEIQNATDFHGNLSSSNGNYFYRLTLNWSSSAPDLDFFKVQYRQGNDSWIDWLPSTTNTSANFTAYYSLLPDTDIYSFRATAQDKNGNQSDWSQVDIDLTPKVVINEVGLFGTTADENDQWVELYNRTDSDIDLTGWQITSGSSTIALSGTILANSYFIMEKNDDDTLSNITADQIFTKDLLPGGFNLYNAEGRFVDNIFKSPNWLKQDLVKDGNTYSLERISQRSLGNQKQNWKINNGVAINGLDRQGNAVYASVGLQNSNYQLYTFLPTELHKKINLPLSLSPFLAPYSSISADAVVTIEPGSVIKFYDAKSGMNIAGTLKAIGSQDLPIIFTSFKDDDCNGVVCDTNSDQDLTSPAPSDWLGFRFLNSQNSNLENIILRYAGASPSSGWASAIETENSNIVLKNSTLEKNNNTAVNLINSASVIDNVNFLEDGNNKAVFVQGGSPTIKNSYFYKNHYAIYVQRWYDAGNNVVESTPIIENNNFEQNQAPVFMSERCYPTFSGNSASENFYNAIIFYPNGVRENTELKPDLPYLIKTALNISNGITLTLNPGVVLEFLDTKSGLIIAGTLKAIGTADNQIIFRPYYNETPSPGNWLGLQFTKTSTDSELDNVNISYAGSCYYGNCGNGQFRSAIRVDDQALISLKNSVLESNANNGLWLTNSLSVVDNTQFNNHTKTSTSTKANAIFIEAGSPEIKNSVFDNNTIQISQKQWTNPDTGEVIDPTPNLHDTDPEDPEKNTFLP